MDTRLQPHHHHFRLILGVSTGLVVLTGVGLWIYFAQPPKTIAPVKIGKVAETIAVPQAFQDFVGSVTAVTGSDVQATFGLTNPNGGTAIRTYTIHTTSATEQKTQTIAAGKEAAFSPLTLSTLKAGDHIHVFANTNLYPISEFTALKIYLIH